MTPLQIPDDDFSAVIFDCDGTLAASMRVHFQSWRFAFQQQVPSFDFTWEEMCSMGGMSIAETVAQLRQRRGVSFDVRKIFEDYDADFEKRVDTVQPVENVVEFARECHRRAIPIAIASGGFRRYVERTLRAIGVAEIFPVIASIDDVRHAKPAPDLFLLAAEKLKVAPEKCLVIEDSPQGKIAADAAGMRCLLVPPQ